MRRSVRRGHSRWLVALLIAVLPSEALADKVRVSNIIDVDFGTLSGIPTDNVRSQNLCVYSNGASGTYSISASGSVAGSEFALINGPHRLPYQVEWSGVSGQSSGTPLTPNVALAGQASSAANQFCNNGPATTASLIIRLRGSDVSVARQGNYAGSLTLIIAAE